MHEHIQFITVPVRLPVTLPVFNFQYGVSIVDIPATSRTAKQNVIRLPGGTLNKRF